ncbi:MAG: precorrin-8X methylmutase [Spirochaetes bacterium GWC1_27_15]|nr:MAG: precorrin-8X methylmutase [Spirochaetes bacterium GWC1_27_15]
MIINPKEIEKKSFEIITKELGHLNIPKEYDPIIKRVIHTTADFDYGRILEFHKDSIKNCVDAIKGRCKIYCDTKMIIAGVNKNELQKFGSEIYSFIDDPEVVSQSKETRITRSIIGIEKACKDKNTKIFVIGNAPTALFKLKELILQKVINPKLIIGVPVGFVGASESKEEIKETSVPYIVTNGRKGGSTVAVAILNAIIYGIKNDT